MTVQKSNMQWNLWLSVLLANIAASKVLCFHVWFLKRNCINVFFKFINFWCVSEMKSICASIVNKGWNKKWSMLQLFYYINVQKDQIILFKIKIVYSALYFWNLILLLWLFGASLVLLRFAGLSKVLKFFCQGDMESLVFLLL